jgi:TolB protein
MPHVSIPMKATTPALFCVWAVAVGYAFAAEPSLGIFDRHADVGDTPKKGSVQYDAPTREYRITGGGANMWESTDAFHFLWKQLSGDVTLTADVRFISTGAVEHRKAALMIRQSLDPDSAYADVARHGDGLTSLQYRPAVHAITEEIRSSVIAPSRIRIERRGDQFTMYVGNPDEELKSSGPVTVVLHDPVYAGLAVCSHDANILETAVFSNVRIEAHAP